jgi:hypothetical protein
MFPPWCSCDKNGPSFDWSTNGSRRHPKNLDRGLPWVRIIMPVSDIVCKLLFCHYDEMVALANVGMIHMEKACSQMLYPFAINAVWDVVVC